MYPEHREPKNDSRAHDLIDMTPEELKDLTRKIKENDGTVLLVIHPYYVERKIQEALVLPSQQTTPRKAKRIQSVLERVIATKKFKMPIIIFEEATNIADTVRRIHTPLQKSENDVFILPTYSRTSEPKFPSPVAMSTPERKEQDWDKLKVLFQKLGVTRALIMGSTLEIAGAQEGFEPYDLKLDAFRTQRIKNGAQNVNYNIKQCVGEAVKELSNGNITIKLSKLTYPDTLHDLLLSEGSTNELNNH